MEENPELMQLFKALADKTRVEILAMLEIRPRSVTEIVDFFMLTQPTVSRHLEVLRNAELVTVEKDGKRRVYHLNEERLRGLMSVFVKKFRCLKHI